MGRLTIKAPSGLIHLKDNKEMTKNEAIKKLSDYEDLEEQGLLPRLPCNPGSTVWICKNDAHKTYKCMVLKYEVFVNGIFVILRIQHDMTNIDVSLKNLGKTWFLTQVEAEEALKRIKK